MNINPFVHFTFACIFYGRWTYWRFCKRKDIKYLNNEKSKIDYSKRLSKVNEIDEIRLEILRKNS